LEKSWIDERGALVNKPWGSSGQDFNRQGMNATVNKALERIIHKPVLGDAAQACKSV
jgi:hypothetical protein